MRFCSDLFAKTGAALTNSSTFASPEGATVSHCHTTGEALVGEAGLEASLKTSNLTRKHGQALLCDELKKAKEDKDNAKKAAKQAAKVEKNCSKRRARLLKARHGSFRSGFFFDRRPAPFSGSRQLETYLATTSRSRPRTRGESIRG